jgi:hypothetical protein
MGVVESDIRRRIERLEKVIEDIRANHLPHLSSEINEALAGVNALKARMYALETMNERSAKSELLGLTIMLWLATPIAFLSIPLIGIPCALTALLSTLGYIRARRYVK